MDIISIIFIAILVVFLIIGLCKGFVKAIISFLGSVVAFVAAGFASKPLGNFLYGLDFIKSWQTDLSTYFNNQGGLFVLDYSSENLKTWASGEFVPDFLSDIIEKIATYLISTDTGVTLGDALANSIVYYGLMVISFVVVFLVVLGVIKLIGILFKKLENGVSFIKLTNRLLGGALYVIIGLIVIGIINYVFSLIISTGGEVANWLSLTMKLEEDAFTFSKFLYQKNILGTIVSWIQQLFLKA